MTAAGRPSVSSENGYQSGVFPLRRSGPACHGRRSTRRPAGVSGHRECPRPEPEPEPEQALAFLMLQRQVREQLAGRDTGLSKTARDADAGWPDLARPFGVVGRQAVEHRCVRGRPGLDSPVLEQPVMVTPRTRAAERSTTWARFNVADLRRLAGHLAGRTRLRPKPSRPGPPCTPPCTPPTLPSSSAPRGPPPLPR